jgi:hypothetical protein
MSDPANRLNEAINDLEQFRRKWNEEGRPLFVPGSRKNLVPHPYIKLIRDAERAVREMAGVSRTTPVGRPQGSGSAPDRRRLKVVAPISAHDRAKASGSGTS